MKQQQRNKGDNVITHTVVKPGALLLKVSNKEKGIKIPAPDKLKLLTDGNASDKPQSLPPTEGYIKYNENDFF